MNQTLTREKTGQDRLRMRGFAACYLRFCAAHLVELKRAVVERRPRCVRRIARVLRGNTSRLGLSELASLGRQLEEHCRGRDWDAVRSTYRVIAATVLELCRSQPVPINVAFGPDGQVQRFQVTRIGFAPSTRRASG